MRRLSLIALVMVSTILGTSWEAMAADRAKMKFRIGPGPEMVIDSLNLEIAGMPRLRTSGKVAVNEKGGIDFDIGTGDALGRVVVDAVGHHHPESGNGKASLRLHPVQFVPGVLQPPDLFPVSDSGLKNIAGSLEAEGEISWRGEEMTSDLRIILSDGSFGIGEVRVEGVNSRIIVNRPWPPATPPGQRLTVRHISGPLPLSAIDVAFQVHDVNSIAINGIWGHLAGGVISLGPVELPLGAEAQEVVLALDGIDAGQLLGIFGMDDISARGRIMGSLPVVLDEEGFEVKGGLLETWGRGRVAYRPASAPSALLGAGEGGNLMLSALDDFHYERLRLTADRDRRGEWRAHLDMQGSNPQVMQGYPFQFSVNLSGRLDEIVAHAMDGWNLPQNIGRAVGGR